MIIPLREATDPAQCGGKAVHLGRMLRAGLPVPNGFVVAADADLKDVRVAYEAMGSPLVAVRSSATAEDLSEASMAGQYQTFLNMSGAESVLKAVESCRASLNSERVTAYLAQHAIDPKNVSVAVIVQRLIPADAAGVLFTVNPTTGAETEMVINASWGLGEAVVSGAVEPDAIRVSTSGEVLEYGLAEKRVQLKPGAHEFEPVPENQQERACLDYAAIRELLRLGKLAANLLGEPLDLEWARQGSQIWILQARPITTLPDTMARLRLERETRAFLERELDAGRGPWVRHNLDETLSNPTPFTWAVIQRFMSAEGGYGRMYRQAGFQPDSAGFLEKIGAGIYLDCARFPRMFAPDYPFEYDVAQLRANPEAAQQPPTIPHGTVAQRAAANRLAAHALATIRKEAQTLDRRFDMEFTPAVAEWVKAENARDLQSLDDEALIALWNAREEKVMGEFGAAAFFPSMIEALALADLRTFLRNHIWDEDIEPLVLELSISPAPDQTLKSHAELREKSVAAWLTRYGHRGPGEFELANPRWRERPRDVAPLADSPDPIAKHQERVAQADRCFQRLAAKLPARKAELSTRVQAVQRYARFREDGKHVLMQGYDVLRQTALEFGRRLGIGERVFYLTPGEVAAALRTGYVPEDKIGRRMTERRVAGQFYTPRVIERSSLDELGHPLLPEHVESYPAYPVSTGSGSGPALVLRRPEDADLAQAGFILVCPSTDPGWTPVFLKAAGLVLERGGTLSHGAIVARELGLPAVVLENATAFFKDGETLYLDARSGLVARSAPSEVMPVPPLPPESDRERADGQKATLAAILWGIVLALIFLIPALKDAAFGLLDAILWPLVANLGYAGAVAAIAGFFGVGLVLAQKLMTDNARILAAKKRDGKASQRRVLRASLVPLGWALGPLMLVFLWFPERVDPAVWAAEPGRAVNVLATLDPETVKSATLEVPSPLALETGSAATQMLPPIREILEDLRREWDTESDLSQEPWELRAAAEQIRQSMRASLDAYLRAGIPPQTLSWRVQVPESAAGSYALKLQAEGREPFSVPLVFGRTVPPTPLEHTLSGNETMRIEYARPLTQRVFWAPLAAIGGPKWDFGWLGVYLVAYVLAMYLAKALFRTP